VREGHCMETVLKMRLVEENRDYRVNSTSTRVT